MSKFTCTLHIFIFFISLSLFNNSLYAQTAESDSFYEKGMEYFGRGDYKKAIAEFKKVWELDSVSLPGNYFSYENGKDWQAYSYLKMGDKAKAKALNPIAYDIAPDDRRKMGKIIDLIQKYNEDLSNQMWLLCEMHLTSALDEAEREFGKNSMTYYQALVILITDYFERGEQKKLNEYIGKLEKLIETYPTESRYLSAYRNLIKGYIDYGNGKYKEALAEARQCRDDLSGIEAHTYYEIGKLLDLMSGIVYYGDPSNFPSPEAALKEVSDMVDKYAHLFFSLPPDKQENALGIMYSVLQSLWLHPNLDLEKADNLVDKYLKILNNIDKEKNPYIDHYRAHATYFRAQIHNDKANRIGSGYDLAWKYADEALKIYRSIPDFEKQSYLELMTVASNALIHLYRLDEALELLNEIIEIGIDKKYDRQYVLVDAINGKAMILQRMGRIDLAIEEMRKYLPTIRSMKNTNPVRVGYFLMNYSTYLGMDKINEKENNAVIKEVVDCFEKVDSPELQYGYFWALLAIASNTVHSEEEAKPIFDKIDSMIASLKANPLATPEYIADQESFVLNSKAEACIGFGNLDKALQHNTEAIELLNKSGIAMKPEFLGTRMRILKDQNKFLETLRVGEEKLNLDRSLFGPNDVTTIATMTDMVDIYSGNLMYDKAEEMVQEIEKSIQTAWTSLSPDFRMRMLIMLGTHYNNMRNYARALEVLEQAKGIKDEGKADPSWETYWFTTYLNSKSKTDRADEVLPEAKKFIDEASKKNYSADQKFQLLTALAPVAKELGELGYASDWYERAFSGYEANDNNVIFYINALLGYNDVLRQLGKEDESRKCAEKFLALIRDFKTDQGVIAEFTNQLTMFCDMAIEGETDSVLTEIQTYMDKIIDKYGLTSELTQNLMKSMLELRNNMNYPPAESFEMGLPIVKQMREENKLGLPEFLIVMLGLSQYTDNPVESDRIIADIEKIPEYQLTQLDKIRFLSSKGLLQLKKHNPDKALKYYREAFDKSREYILDNFLSMSAEERETFWNNTYQFFKIQIPQAVAIAMGMGGEGFQALAYECALFTNSLLLSSDMTIDEAASLSKDKKVKKAYQEYQSCKQLTADAEKQYVQLKESNPELDNHITELRNALRKSERTLLNMLSDKLGQYNRHLAIDTEDVRRQLKPTDAAIEFLEFPVDGNPSQNQYMAALIRGGEQDVKLIPLFAIAPDNEGWQKCYDSDELFNVLWKPIEPYLKGVTDIWFAPQGKLSVTAIESLPGLETLDLGNPYVMHRLTSTRQLALNRSDSGKKRNKQYVAYGGINYSADSKEISEADKERKRTRKKGTRSLVTARDIFGDGARDMGAGIDELPGTETEARYLVELVNEQHKGNSTLLNGSKATEASFKDYSGNTPLLLHIGTHGFYFDDALNAPQGGNSQISPEELAMQHSGLLLAGAEQGLFEPDSLPEDAEDGILTAAEISRLDLSDSELIVMSACETGLGKISADGVFGLQRGFKKAGAEALMMSLWKVDDEATTELMKSFYDGWLREGLSKNEALLKAKASLRAVPRWNNPRYWAPFILLDALD